MLMMDTLTVPLRAEVLASRQSAQLYFPGFPGRLTDALAACRAGGSPKLPTLSTPCKDSRQRAIAAVICSQGLPDGKKVVNLYLGLRVSHRTQPAEVICLLLHHVQLTFIFQLEARTFCYRENVNLYVYTPWYRIIPIHITIYDRT